MAQTHNPGDGEGEFTPAPGAGPGPEHEYEHPYGQDAEQAPEAEADYDPEQTTVARAQGQPPGAPYGGPSTPGRGIAAALGTLGDGRYRLTHKLGRGGMAEVLAAQDVRLGRQVAVKLLRPELAQDEVSRLRFTREAHSVASLNHHSIVAVYDTGEELVGGESTPYIVMELVEGKTVRELLVDEEAPPVDQALIIIAGVLEALDYSHRHGIVHRDIKPANVIITTTGAVKVMDFGIARALTGAASTMTQTGMVMGTPQYLSPEQALGKPVDHRSDLYAAGCMLYELLTLRPPFTGDTPLSVVYQHVQDAPVPPSQANDRVPYQLDELVLRSLAKNPDERFQSADEFRAHVQHALREMHGAGGYPTTALGGFGTGQSGYDGTPGQGTAVTAIFGAGAAGRPGDQTTVLPYGAAAGGYPTSQTPYGGAGGAGGSSGGGDGYGGGYEEQPRSGGGRRKALGWAVGVLLVVAAGIGVAVAANGGGSSGGGGNPVNPVAPSNSTSVSDSPSDAPTTASPTTPSTSPSQSRSRTPYQPPTEPSQPTYQPPTYRPPHSTAPSTSPSSAGSPSTAPSSPSTGSSPSGSTGGGGSSPSGGSTASGGPTGSTGGGTGGTGGGTGGTGGGTGGTGGGTGGTPSAPAGGQAGGGTGGHSILPITPASN
ncbi:protein kinase domain-containing protein [Kitasatospora kifunensis]|uniref:non-specific serine/threonine protein kinase n=1 Tax=Kitasatospora kifunensis TaxID=58351 RepID=A0A7W7R3C6_KITKI|nr:protein kinase [Kitasatospora kifunensis]MBB4924515.1 serine/threonine-protein kinase [Kitasatospora kifunensis]